ncbi:MAG: hypothetical protein LQ351_002330 [Letrouitia transgressa]|nr:MAG: hypothetical protein LQ351_002330 [Letrouitia transgressa]
MIAPLERQLSSFDGGRMSDPSPQRPQDTHNFGIAQSTNGNPPISRPPLNAYHSYDGKENNGFDVGTDDGTKDDTGTGDGKKKKGSASSIANDMELRRLFRENVGRSLKDVAVQVLANERGPRSEKTKQIFAMLWYLGPKMNPKTSFGKLVRIIFPGIQTRRLGMRGESKYHYVDLSLSDDHQEGADNERFQPVRDPNATTTENVSRLQRPQLPADTAIFPTPDIPFNSAFTVPETRRNKALECLYLHRTPESMQQIPSRPNMVGRELKFSSREEQSFRDEEAIELPSIHNYAPIGTDPDAADALTALYRSHCVSVIDSFRFCKERMLWHHFTSFHGTLTVPVQKLFAHASISPWIKECDWLMYQRMVKFVAPLALQVVPLKVIDTFRAISAKLAGHISTTFQNHPQHVRDAKLGPGTIFAGLLDRLLRVNATAHAAANMLTNDANRDQMWHDWVLYVKPTKAVESSLPGTGYLRTLRILATEVRHLLGPLRTMTYMGMDPIFEETINGTHPHYSENSHSTAGGSSTEGVLDRWTNFLHTLPSLFPHADARMVLHCAGAVGDAALRDITMAQALSFGSWWVTKTWVDEMLLWMAEKGGFMDHTPSTMEMRGSWNVERESGYTMDDTSDIFAGSRPRTAASDSLEAPSRFGSVDAASGFRPDHGRRATTEHDDDRNAMALGLGTAQINARGPLENDESHVNMYSHNPDDSGIGMDAEQSETHPEGYSKYVTDGPNIVSDPADVVVC